MLTALGLEVQDVRVAVFTGCHGDDDPICGFDAGTGASFACSEFGVDVESRLHGARVWLRADHAVVRDALKMGGLDPLFASMAVIAGMSTQLGLSSTQLASLADVVERDLMTTKRRRLGPAR